MTEITHVVLGPLETNCYFLRDTETGDVLVVDPGWYDPLLEREVRRVGACLLYTSPSPRDRG